MGKNIAFTFVLPVHNGGEFLKEQIESILSQDYDNYNLVVLENCSNDGTLEYLQSIKDPKLSIVPSNNLLSMEDNWKRVLTIQKNQYTIFAMADDKYETNYLSELVNIILKYPGMNIYRTNIKLIDKNSNIIDQSNIPEKITFKEYLKGRLNHTYFEIFQGYCFDTKFYDKIGGIECIYNAMYMDDKIVLTAIGKNFMPVAKSFACCYRTNPESVSGTPDFDSDFGGFNYFFNWLKSKNDIQINNIVKDYLPYHLSIVANFFSKEQMLEYYKIYELFNINPKSKRYRWVKFRDKYLYIKKQRLETRIRFLFIKLRFKRNANNG